MCGIAGLCSSQALSEEQLFNLKTVVNNLSHRGPDSDGFFYSENVSLGMRRLSINDLTTGSQPLFNEDRTIALVCNGEIYNFIELREKLISLGYSFSSKSDVEVVIYLYEEYGPDCFAQLRGMFAIALYDARRNSVFLVRDRLGEKPLFYSHDHSTLYFSSEFTQLLHIHSTSPRISPSAFNLYLTFQYLPEPFSFVDNISQLPAAHYLEFNCADSTFILQRYWFPEHLSSSEPFSSDYLFDLLKSSCLLMNHADVPVALALSGGVDSSLVAALSADITKDICAFSVGYQGNPSSDERSKAAYLADYLGIPFLPIEISDADVENCFPDLVQAMDLPIADIAALGYYKVSQASRQNGFPVLLSGLGGDEVFWGYQWVKDTLTNATNSSRSKLSRLRSLLTRSKSSTPSFFGQHSFLSSANELSRQIIPAERLSNAPSDFWLVHNSIDTSIPPHLGVFDLLSRTWLRSNCLTLMDRVSMANSVEVRLPLLDNHLVDYMISQRNSGLRDWELPCKSLLLRSLESVLPNEVLSRKKQGFTPPVRRWYKLVINKYSNLLFGGSLQRQGLIDTSIFTPSYFSQLPLDFSYKLLLMEMWSRCHVEKTPIRDFS